MPPIYGREPHRYRPHRGPIWIDPRHLDRYGWPDANAWDWPQSTPVDEDRIRRIVREEIAKLPIPFDVPDTPPEA